jgi:hypothetical protein
MCTILLAWRVVPGVPVILAANRDELVARPSLPPLVLRSEPLIAGGQDALAGGTWLAVRADGAVAAVTNRRTGERDPQRRSRGELPLMLLEAQDPRAVLDGLHARDYNPFNALHVSPSSAMAAEAHGNELRVFALQPGLHVITVYDVDDVAQRKVAWLTAEFHALRASNAAALLDGMEELLRDRGEPGRDGPEAACVDLGEYGTVSSSSVVVDDTGHITYHHAPGKPCVTPFEDVSALLEMPLQSSAG